MNMVPARQRQAALVYLVISLPYFFRNLRIKVKHSFYLILHFVMQIQLLKSKIHRAVVTEADLNYVGSITLDEDLMDAAQILEHEKVQVVNVNNGARLETYVIKGERGSGVVCLNGPAARLCAVGDIVIVISYALMDVEEAKQYKPVTIFPKEGNKL